MKKTIVVEFPDGFEFPEITDADEYGGKCSKCPLMIDYDGYWFGCYVTDANDTPCPFYGGADTATLRREPRKQFKAKMTDNEKTDAEALAAALLRLPSSRIRIMLASSLGRVLMED